MFSFVDACLLCCVESGVYLVLYKTVEIIKILKCFINRIISLTNPFRFTHVEIFVFKNVSQEQQLRASVFKDFGFHSICLNVCLRVEITYFSATKFLQNRGLKTVLKKLKA